MGAKLRPLSGEELIAIFEKFGFVAIKQTGSHVKLRRISATGTQMLVIPDHDDLPKGTLRAILGQATRFIPTEQLHPLFYTSPH